jgi:hypothetical protein
LFFISAHKHYFTCLIFGNKMMNSEIWCVAVANIFYVYVILNEGTNPLQRIR